MIRTLVLLLGATFLVTTPGRAQSIDSFCVESHGIDEDADSLPDRCEFELAKQFAPLLTVTPGTCNAPGPVPRPGGGYFFAVQRVGAAVRIAYLPAYFEDCGWYGVKCWIPVVDCSPHAGDSEFIVVEVIFSGAGTYDVSGIFLSAHCFGRSNKDCRWYRGQELKSFEWYGAAPIIWVAEGRNANYPTRRACDKGHHSLDTCDDSAFRFGFPVDARKNIGSKRAPLHPGGCVTGKELAVSTAEPDAVECFWDPSASFRGWKSRVPGVTGYYRYLTEIAGF